MAVAVAVKRWTLEELHSLPDDGNKYEVIDGELFVTPAPAPEHEDIAARLTRLIDPYVAANGLGYVYRPKSVFQVGKRSEVEPDLMVRQPGGRIKDWARLPKPILVVEIGSPSTWRRDREHKRSFYLKHGIPEYWIVDPNEREIIQIRPDEKDVFCRRRLTWRPKGPKPPLVLDVAAVFSD